MATFKGEKEFVNPITGESETLTAQATVSDDQTITLKDFNIDVEAMANSAVNKELEFSSLKKYFQAIEVYAEKENNVTELTVNPDKDADMLYNAFAPFVLECKDACGYIPFRIIAIKDRELNTEFEPGAENEILDNAVPKGTLTYIEPETENKRTLTIYDNLDYGFNVKEQRVLLFDKKEPKKCKLFIINIK